MSPSFGAMHSGKRTQIQGTPVATVACKTLLLRKRLGTAALSFVHPEL